MTTKNVRRSVVFGGGEKSKVLYSVSLPVVIGDISCFLDVSVIPGNLPLLLSEKSMSKAKFIIDFARNKVLLPTGYEIAVTRASSGHMLLDILKHEKNDYILFPESKSLSEAEISKLHRQFGHCSADKLSSLVRNAGNKVSASIETIGKIIEKCEICRQFGRSSPKPVTCLPLSVSWNETIAMDLHKMVELGKGVWYLHIIDLFTRFSVAIFIKNKRAETIVEQFAINWGLAFGFPKNVLFDNGGEFENEIMKSMGENYDFTIKTTAARSPWSNGVVERHNAVITEMFLKMRADDQVNATDDMVLKYAVFAKNSLYNKDGFSPYQLLFGSNARLPNVFGHKEPALENTTTSEVISQHIRLLNTSRRAFLESESSNRVKKALKSKIYADKDVNFEYGQSVYYKMDNENRWRGPGTVTGIDRSVIFVRHGGSLRRVHKSKLRSATSLENWTSQESGMQLLPKTDEIPAYQGQICVNPVDQRQKSGLTDDEQSLERLENINFDDSDDNQVIQKDLKSKTDDSDVATTSFRPHKVKIGEKVMFISNEPGFDGENIVATVISRGGKARGKNKDWWNVTYDQPECIRGQTDCVDVTKLQDFDVMTSESVIPIGPVTEENAAEVFMAVSDEFHEQKKEEFKSWASNNVFEKVEDAGQLYLNTRWVLTDKDGRKKARLVVKGFEDPEYYNVIKDSPTCSKDAFRILLAISSCKGWISHSIDIKTAFLQGEDLKREVHLKPPVEADEPPTVLWRLKKCVYGLVDAARHWYERVKSVILSTGCQVSAFDPSLFIYKENGVLLGLIATHVDDFWWSGTQNFGKCRYQKDFVGFRCEKVRKSSLQVPRIRRFRRHRRYQDRPATICLGD